MYSNILILYIINHCFRIEIIVDFKLKPILAKMHQEPNGQLIKNENTMDFHSVGPNLLPNNGPKRYSQYATKSADFNNIQVNKTLS